MTTSRTALLGSLVLLLCPLGLVHGQWNVTQLTNNSFDDDGPQVSGSNVVWIGSDGNDYEIFLARVPEPASLVLTLMGAAALTLFVRTKNPRPF